MMQNYNDNILHMILESNLKSLGSIAVEVIKSINEERELEDIENLVLKDVALTAQVIRVANSYKSKEEVERSSLRKAILRLGFDGLRSICICIAIIENIPARQHRQKDMIVDALLRSFETANLARNLIVRMGNEDPHTAYISGLLRNIGELCFLSSAVPNLPNYQELMESGLTNEQACLTLCGCDYDDLTEQIVESWELPITINDSLQPQPYTDFGKAVQVANELTQAIRSGRESKAFTQVSRRLVDEFDLSFKETVDFVREGFQVSREEFGQYVPGIKQIDEGISQPVIRPAGESEFDSHGVATAVKKIIELGKNHVKRSTCYSVLTDALYNFVAFEKVVVADVDRKNQRLTAVTASGADTNALRQGFSFDLSLRDSLINQLLASHDPYLINESTAADVLKQLGEEFKSLVGEKPLFYLCPIVENEDVVGVVYMDPGDGVAMIEDRQRAAADQLIQAVSSISPELR